jgi:DNA-binding CsgD family transcriptional regulator
MVQSREVGAQALQQWASNGLTISESAVSKGSNAVESHHRDLREASHALAAFTIDTWRVRVEVAGINNQQQSIASFRLNDICYVLLTEDGPRKGLPALTRREREIAMQIARGYGTKQIAHYLGISPHTTITYVNRIRTKLGVRNRPEMVAALLGGQAEPRQLASNNTDD